VSAPRGRVVRAELPATGLILDGASDRPLAEADIVELGTRSGDRVWLTTHPGHGYKALNEDRIAVVETADRGGVLAGFFVIDGMGGHRGGDISAQTLAEELVEAYRLDSNRLGVRCRELLLAQIVEAVDQLPSDALVNAAAEAFHAAVFQRSSELEPRQILEVSVEAVQGASTRVTSPDPDQLRQIAAVIGALSRLGVPGRAEVAVARARARLAAFGLDAQAPDACFVGAVIRTAPDGSRRLDVKQVGDCKLFVADREGRLRFQTINQSMVPEPNLRDPRLTIDQLLAYSLHRNIVSSSLMSFRALKRYRRDEIPLTLQAGDLVCLYSDGCDDLFAPEELVELGRGPSSALFLRALLVSSERRMRYVHGLLAAALDRLGPGERVHAYPAVHQAMHEARLRDGCYLERYGDGAVGRWLKPPKCDNLAFCMVRIGGAAPG
jgi:serine/threonine protein phosphatase PrpC